ncbi:MAG: PQQ-binding-like beta-propeller repeat protein [Planctomycetales bacterium]|nr:PQQ-binding-like beta-propeller repeat protein [Planctomycetales bacterium]
MHIISPPSVRRHVLTGLVAFGCMSLAWASDSFAQDNWPEFRGPHSNGWADESSHPAVEFGEGNHVTWKTEIHGRGWSSPVVWGNQIWMGTADEDGKHFYGICVNKETGEIEHDLVLFEEAEPKFCHDMNSYASPTPVIEEGFVYLHFGSYGTACLSTADASVVWSRRDLPCDHFRGPGSSPILWGDLLIMHYDGFDYQYAIALNKRTGETVWRNDRDIDYGTDNGDVMKAYNTPSIIEVDGRPLLISSTSKACLALDPATGEEVWRLRYSGFSSTGRPFMAGGLLYINSGFSTAELFAIRPDGEGDITDSHVVWSTNKGIGSKPSQIVVDGVIYSIHDQGTLNVFDATTGEELWRKRLDGGLFSASPILAGGNLYFCSHEGPVTVIRPGREPEVLAVNEFDQGFMSSPAVSGDSLFLRSRTHLYRIDP